MNVQEQSMPPRQVPQQWLFWGVFILMLVAVASTGIWSLLNQRKLGTRMAASRLQHLPIYGVVPDFSLIERSGRQVKKADLQGQIWIANFIFTNCPDQCPLMTSQMAELQTALSRARDIRLVSFTVDPERDTPEVLSEYAKYFGADRDRWLFLTGVKEAIYDLARESFHVGVIDPRDETQDENASGTLSHTHGKEKEKAGEKTGMILHSSRFILVDRQAQIRGYYNIADGEIVQRVLLGVGALLREKEL